MKSRFKTQIPSKILLDGRFITIINLLNKFNSNSAIYLVRLVTGFDLKVSKNYIYKLELIYKNCKNKMQGYRFDSTDL